MNIQYLGKIHIRWKIENQTKIAVIADDFDILHL